MDTPLFTMEKTSIKINLEGGSYLELQSPSEDVSNDLYTLSQEGFNCTIPGTAFECCIPPFGKTHMLVETPRSTVGSPEVVVYGVKCEQEAKMTPEQVANRVLEAFEVNVQENFTVLRSPDGISEESNGEAAYPCGTLFTSGTYSRSSGSSGSCWSPGPPTPEHYHTPTPSQRPLRLPITNNANANLQLTTPHPVATPNSTIPNHALVAGTGSFNMGGDQCDQALEDSALAPEINCREGMVTVQTAHHQTLLPVQKVQAQEAGELSVDPLVIVLETPSKPNTQFKMTVEEDSAPTEKSLKPVEFSSEESEHRLPSQPEQGGLNSSMDKKSLNNQLVVGIGPSRSSLVPPSFGRQRSLPGPEKVEKSSASILPRNASDVCLVALGEDKPSTQRSRRFSDIGLNLKVSACEQTVEELPKETPPTPTKETMTTPTKETLGTPTKDTLATSPTKPLAIERQESVVDPGQVEYVLPRTTNVVLCDQSPQDAHKPVMNMLFKVVENENENEEASVHSDANCEAREGGDACDPGEVCDSREECENSGINFQVVPTSNDSPSPSSDPPEHASDKDARMVQVHLLEHAMNGYCILKDTCKAGVHGNLEFTQAVDQMRAMVEEARNGQQDEDLQGYIRLHCRNCRDKDCKVPHMMAGCSPPGETFSGSETDQTDSPQRSSSPYQESPVTFDQEVNQSTTSEFERHQAQAQYRPAAFQRPLTPASYGQPTSNMYTEGTDFGIQPSQDQTAPFSPHLPRRNGPPLLQGPMGPSYLNSPSMLKHFQAEGAGSGLVSPMGSTGFLLPGVLRGNHQQESQLGAESYIQQVSDKRQAEVKPREKGQYQYIEPSRSGSGLRKMYGASENRHLSVKAGQFPSYQALPKKPGSVIYAAQGSDLIPGESYPCPQSVPDRDKLGKGGNGTVVKFPLGGTEYALKLTQYREGELNSWSQLNHPNIVPLEGVMMAEKSHYCYQFMPRMTGDLRSMMIDRGDLLTHLTKNSKEWVVVMRNTVYILREVLRGLRYLHSLNIQHSDFKANNVLIMKKCTCPDILHCVCTDQDKYDVKIADFDSLKKSKFSRSVVQFSEICREPMNDMELNGVKGTPAYRAPEQFKNCPKRSEFKRTLEDGKDLYDMEGPWCDMWSLGVVVLQMVLGSHNKGPYISEASILTSCRAEKMQPRVEATVATLRRSQLLSLAHTHPELKPLAAIAEECLKVDCRMRSTAEAVLNMLEDQTQTL